jgi:putative transposase
MEYAAYVKARMVRRMVEPTAVSASRLADETGIPQPTLSRWLREAASIKDVSRPKPPSTLSAPTPAEPKRPQDWTALERAQLVLEASRLPEDELGEFLRRKVCTRAPGRVGGGSRGGAGATTTGVPGAQLTPSASRNSSGRSRARTRRWPRRRRPGSQKKTGGPVGGRGRRHRRAERQVILGYLDEAIGARAGPAAACDLVGIDERTIQRWRARPAGDDERRGPNSKPDNALSAKEEAKIIALVTSKEFVDLSPHQLIAKLADMCIYIASEATIYRLLRRRRLLRHRDRSRPPYAPPSARVRRHRTQPGMGLGHHLPAAGVRGTFWYLYSILDVWSRKIVGWAVHDVQSDELAAQLAEEACRREDVEAGRLVLHADNGAAMKGNTMLVKLEEFGVAPSFSRPRVSDDNPSSEALFRTMKYRPSSPDRSFLTSDDARQWVATFVAWYNDDHQHSGIRFDTPSQRHDGRETPILAHRHRVYLEARARRPGRWNPSHSQLVTRCDRPSQPRARRRHAEPFTLSGANSLDTHRYDLVR